MTDKKTTLVQQLDRIHPRWRRLSNAELAILYHRAIRRLDARVYMPVGRLLVFYAPQRRRHK